MNARLSEVVLAFVMAAPLFSCANASNADATQDAGVGAGHVTCPSAACTSIADYDKKVSPGGITVDATSVYWIVNSGATSSQLMKADLSGGTPVTLASLQEGMWHVAVDANAAYVTSGTTLGSVTKIDLSGGDPVTLASNQHYPSRIVVGANAVYWINSSEYGKTIGAVMKVDLAGGEPVTLASNLDAPTGIALGSDSLYWAFGPFTDSTIMKMGLSAGTPEVFATTQSDVTDIAVDANAVYWTEGWGTQPQVMKVALSGGTPVVLATDSGSRLVLDSDAAYWIGSSGNAERTVMKVGLSGGTPVCLGVVTDGYATDLAVGANAVYWTAGFVGGGVVVKTAK